MSPVATLVEWATRFLMLVALPEGHRAELVADALAAKIQTLPAVVARTLTWDQGHEMAEHARFTVATGVKVYFCDPKSPWQRGANENMNGLLRQYLPRGARCSTPPRVDHTWARIPNPYPMPSQTWDSMRPDVNRSAFPDRLRAGTN
jgi:IS30 family transposase